MLIYYESKIKNSPLTKEIFKKFGNCEKIEIQHYKNLFDLNIGNYKTEKLIILAKQEYIAILDTPKNYGFPGKSFFIKPSLNCFFQCKYCYLQGTFKNRFPVFFLNYEDIQKEMINKIQEENKKGFKGQITFYASNYTDLLATEEISQFHKHFLPFCESLPKNVLIETRTKSSNIQSLIQYSEEIKKQGKSPTQNMEFAFSLSPNEITEKYELGTASLNQKIIAINRLIEKGFRVGLRFLPLLPVKDFYIVYGKFLDQIIPKLPIKKISSITIAPLIFNQGDYNILLKKYCVDPEFSFINKLKKNEHNLRTCTDKEISEFKNLFENKFIGTKLFRDYI